MITSPQLEKRPSQRYAAIRAAVPIPFGKYIQPLWNEVSQWLKEKEVQPGPAIIRYLTTDMSARLDIDVGFAIDTVLPDEGRVFTEELPGGQYATMLYTGPYKGKGLYKATVVLLDWAKESGVRWATTEKNGKEWWNGRAEFYFSDTAKGTDSKKYKAELAFLTQESSTV
jgi:effector-binding domain-containing protein